LRRISDTHIQQAKWPDSVDVGIDGFRFMRVSDEQQVDLGACRRRLGRVPASRAAFT